MSFCGEEGGSFSYIAIVLDAAILTGDNDFLGCGCPTWTVETLSQELNA